MDMKFIDIKASSATTGMVVLFDGTFQEIVRVNRCVLSQQHVFITLSLHGEGIWGNNDNLNLVVDIDALHAEALAMNAAFYSDALKAELGRLEDDADGLPHNVATMQKSIFSAGKTVDQSKKSHNFYCPKK